MWCSVKGWVTKGISLSRLLYNLADQLFTYAILGLLRAPGALIIQILGATAAHFNSVSVSVNVTVSNWLSSPVSPQSVCVVA